MNQGQHTDADETSPTHSPARRFWLTFLVVWLATSVVAAATYALLYFQFPLYTATALIECISDQPKPEFSIQQAPLADDHLRRFISSQAEYFVSAPVIDQVLRDAEVRTTDWFRETPLQSLQSRLAKNLSAAQVEDTNYLEASFAAPNPANASKIVNIAVSRYLSSIRDLSTMRFRQQLTEAGRTRNDLQDRIIRKSEEIRSITMTFPPPMVGTDLNPLIDAHRAAQVRLDEVDAALAEAHAHADRLALSAAASESGEQFEHLAAADPIYARYASEHAHQAIECEKLRAVTTNGAGSTDASLNQCAHLQDWLAQQMQLRLAALTRAELVHAQLKVDQLQRTRAQRAERVEKHSAALHDAKLRLVDYERLLEEQREQTDLAERLILHLHELERIVQQRDAIQIRAATLATEPTERSFPRPWLLVAMLGFSLLLSSIFAWSAQRRASAPRP